MKIKAETLLSKTYYEGKYKKDPLEFSYVGSFKTYQALSAGPHTDPEKDDKILIQGFCKIRNMNIEIQLPKDMDVEIS